MFASGKESILNSIFRIWPVPQEPKSPLVKHGQVARCSIVGFLCALIQETGVKSSLTFSQRLCCRQNVPPLQATLARPTSLPLHYFSADLGLLQTGSKQPTNQKKPYGNVSKPLKLMRKRRSGGGWCRERSKATSTRVDDC